MRQIIVAIAITAATGGLMLAQGLPNPDGIDLSGSWAARNMTDAIGNATGNGGGPRPVDYMGIPLNETGRAWSLTYSQSQISMPERICAEYAPTYIAAHSTRRRKASVSSRHGRSRPRSRRSAAARRV